MTARNAANRLGKNATAAEELKPGKDQVCWTGHISIVLIVAWAFLPLEMVTLSPVFFRIITFLGSMLLPKNRGYMEVDIHCAGIKILKTLSHTTKQMSIYTINVLSLVYRDLVEILAYGSLGKEPAKPYYFLENLVFCQFLHVAWERKINNLNKIKQSRSILRADFILVTTKN